MLLFVVLPKKGMVVTHERNDIEAFLYFHTYWLWEWLKDEVLIRLFLLLFDIILVSFQLKVYPKVNCILCLVITQLYLMTYQIVLIYHFTTLVFVPAYTRCPCYKLINVLKLFSTDFLCGTVSQSVCHSYISKADHNIAWILQKPFLRFLLPRKRENP